MIRALVRILISHVGTDIILFLLQLYDNHRIDSMRALPAGFESATMQANNPGIWLITSEVANHLSGMLSASDHWLDQHICYQVYSGWFVRDTLLVHEKPIPNSCK